MTDHRDHLPQLDADLFLTDGGIETTLIYEYGFDLPDFAAFPLLDTADGRAALDRYFDGYAEIAARDGLGIVLETPTWRASTDWGSRLGFDAADIERLNRDAVALVASVRDRHPSASPIVVSGCIGPRGDGYSPDQLMSVAEARRYHALQARAFDAAGADMIAAITMTYPEEAIGIVEAAGAVGLPVAISFTVETDGHLPTGASLADAICAVDGATGAAPAYYMVNCAHTSHFDTVLEPGTAWARRIRGIRANASTASHAQLDEATSLDAGDPHDLADRYRHLRHLHPQLTVVGGCCGTGHEHVSLISEACTASALPTG